MSIAITCPGCGKAYSLRDELAGKRVKCKCGREMVVPQPAAEVNADDSTYALASDADSLGSLLDEELTPKAQAAPAGSTTESPPPEVAEEPDHQKIKKTAKRGEPSRLTASLIFLGSVFGLLAFMGLIALVVLWLFRPGYGSPEEVFAAHQEALQKRDWDTLIRTHTPESQERVLGRMMMFLCLSREEIGPEIQAVLDKHGVEIALGEQASETTPVTAVTASEPTTSSDAVATAETPVSTDVVNTSRETASPGAGTVPDFGELVQAMEQRQRRMEERQRQAVSTVKDRAMFYVDLIAALEAERERRLPENPVLAILAKQPAAEARQALAGATLDGLTIKEDTAEGRMTFTPPGFDEPLVAPVLFKKIGGRWLIDLPALDGSDALAFSTLFGNF